MHIRCNGIRSKGHRRFRQCYVHRARNIPVSHSPHAGRRVLCASVQAIPEPCRRRCPSAPEGGGAHTHWNMSYRTWMDRHGMIREFDEWRKEVRMILCDIPPVGQGALCDFAWCALSESRRGRRTSNLSSRAGCSLDFYASVYLGYRVRMDNTGWTWLFLHTAEDVNG